MRLRENNAAVPLRDDPTAHYKNLKPARLNPVGGRAAAGGIMLGQGVEDLLHVIVLFQLVDQRQDFRRLVLR